MWIWKMSECVRDNTLFKHLFDCVIYQDFYFNMFICFTWFYERKYAQKKYKNNNLKSKLLFTPLLNKDILISVTTKNRSGFFNFWLFLLYIFMDIIIICHDCICVSKIVNKLYKKFITIFFKSANNSKLQT